MEVINFFLNNLRNLSDYVEFYQLQGLLGAISGLTFFCIFILIYKLLTQEKFLPDLNVPDELKDFGDPIEARINIARSFIEMNRIDEALKNLNEVIEQKDSSPDQIRAAKELLKKANAF